MLKTMKGKIIITIMTVFILSISTLTVLTSIQVKKKTEENLVKQSELFTSEMNQSITYFFEQFEKGLLQLVESEEIRDLSVEKETGEFTPEAIRQSEKKLDAFMELYTDADSIYYSLETKRSVSSPPSISTEEIDDTDRPWYLQSMENPDEIQWTSPYIDYQTGEYVITVSKAIKKGNQIQGVIGIDVLIESLTNKISEKDIHFQGYPIILDQEGVAIVHPTQRAESLKESPFFDDMYAQSSSAFNYSENGKEKMTIYDTNEELGWKIGVVYDKDEMNEMANQLMWLMILFAVVTSLLFFVVLYLLINHQMKPIGVLNRLMKSVTEGDLTVQSNIKTPDELGSLAANFDYMIDHTHQMVTVVQQSATDVRSRSEQLSSVAEETTATSEEVASAVAEIANGASKTANEAEIVVERSEQLATEINEIMGRAGYMEKVATQAEEMNLGARSQMSELKHSFHSSDIDIQNMSAVITTLEQKVGAIGLIMDTITDISSQTNLLALNASIEAARAGEHGQGFAVVAEEVRKLAEQSARSTEEVRQTVKELQEESTLVAERMAATRENFKTQGSVVEETEDTFMEISTLMNTMQESIASVVEEIQTIDHLKNDVAETLQTMVATSQETAAACEEVSASTDEQLHAIQSVTEASVELTHLSEQLSEVIRQFKTD